MINLPIELWYTIINYLKEEIIHLGSANRYLYGVTFHRKKFVAKNINNLCEVPYFITHLAFDSDWNQKIEKGTLPETLTHLIFGDELNQKIEKGTFPDTLTHLTFGKNFDQKIEKGTLPETLQIVKIWRRRKHLLKELPQNTVIEYHD